MDVNIPMPILIPMFHTGLNSLQKLEARAMRRREAYASISDLDLAQYNANVLSNNPFTVFDTYEAFRVYRNQLMMQQMTGQELAMLIKEEEEDFIINNTELNINCCIMMLDMIMKQYHIQRVAPHLGIFNPFAKEIMLLMSKQLILPWAKKHRCKQPFGFLSSDSPAAVAAMAAAAAQSAASSASTSTSAAASSAPTASGAAANPSTASSSVATPICCQFCEEYVLWFAFARDILIHIAPRQVKLDFYYLV